MQVKYTDRKENVYVLYYELIKSKLALTYYPKYAAVISKMLFKNSFYRLISYVLKYFSVVNATDCIDEIVYGNIYEKLLSLIQSPLAKNKPLLYIRDENI